MELQFEQYQEGAGSLLECPACGGNYLHHEVVEVFERTEDAEEGLHIKIEGGTAITDSNLSGNPSARRHGLTVEFYCEHCKARPVLSIAQHKGTTWIDISKGN